MKPATAFRRPSSAGINSRRWFPARIAHTVLPLFVFSVVLCAGRLLLSLTEVGPAVMLVFVVMAALVVMLGTRPRLAQRMPAPAVPRQRRGGLDRSGRER